MGILKEKVEEIREQKKVRPNNDDPLDISKKTVEILEMAKKTVDSLPWFAAPPLFRNPEDRYLWYRVSNEDELSAIQLFYFNSDADGMYEDIDQYPIWILARVTAENTGNILTMDEVLPLLKEYPEYVKKNAAIKEVKLDCKAAQEAGLKYKYSIAPPERLREVCISQHWFTGGSNEQYRKLFQLNEENASLDLITRAIWMCSDDYVDHIQRVLEKERDAYQAASKPEKFFALRLSVLEEKQFAVKEADLESAQDLLLKAYNAGAVDMSGESTERSVEVHWVKDDQEYIDACGVSEYATIDWF